MDGNICQRCSATSHCVAAWQLSTAGPVKSWKCCPPSKTIRFRVATPRDHSDFLAMASINAWCDFLVGFGQASAQKTSKDYKRNRGKKMQKDAKRCKKQPAFDRCKTLRVRSSCSLMGNIYFNLQFSHALQEAKNLHPSSSHSTVCDHGTEGRQVWHYLFRYLFKEQQRKCPFPSLLRIR